MKRILVTGANGFIGRSVCRQLVEQGHEVTGVIRQLDLQRPLPAGVSRLPLGDLRKFDIWKAALQKTDVVVHLAARTHVMREVAANPLEAYREINVEVTRRLIEGCQAAGVERVIYLSSIKAVGEGQAEPYHESSPCQPADHYGSSKREAEQLVFRAALDHGLDFVVLRPPLVYGPGVGGNFRRIVGAVRRGIPLPLESVNNQRSMVYVENLASAVAACIEHPRARQSVFHVADNETVSTPEFIRLIAQAGQVPCRLLPCPVGILRLLGRVTRQRGTVDRLVDSLTVSNEQIRKRLGWSPPFSVEQGIQITIGQDNVANDSQASSTSFPRSRAA